MTFEGFGAAADEEHASVLDNDGADADKGR